MKKTMIIVAALPVLFFGAGFGAGNLLGKPQDTAPAHEAVAAEASGGHETAADSHDDGAGEEKTSNARVVNVGRMMVPVYKPNSVTYVVADFGVAIGNPDHASEYMIEANKIQLRDAIYESLMHAATQPVLAGAAIDTDALSAAIQADLKPRFAEVEQVLFLSFFKKDVPRT